MKAMKNKIPVAPFNLRETGPLSQAELNRRLGKGWRFAHGVGADRRATLDPSPCPHCKGKVEWALTYKRKGDEVVPFMYARCRSAPKSHRWGFAQMVDGPTVGAQRSARPTPPTPPTPKGKAEIDAWIDGKRAALELQIKALEVELQDLTEIRRLAARVEGIEPRASH